MYKSRQFGFTHLRKLFEESQFAVLRGKEDIAWLAPEVVAVKAIDIGDAELDSLSAQPTLVALDMSGCDAIIDQGLTGLARLRSLKELITSACERITDDGLKQISELNSLELLDISLCHLVSDTGLSYLTNLSLLSQLNLNWCYNITDDGLKELAKISSLETLYLWSCEEIRPRTRSPSPAPRVESSSVAGVCKHNR